MPRWHSCNILQTAAAANRLWQFDAKGGGFALSRELSSASGQPLPTKFTAKSWASLWQPKLNVAWLPPENVFLRVIELPKSNLEETRSMVEFQLEKLSPIPVTQIVWTFQILPQQASPENFQVVVVVVAERRAVEEFLGKLETLGFLADRLEVPMLDQLQSAPANEDGAWVYPATLNGQNAALVAWWFGAALKSLSFIVLPPAGNRTKSLQEQLAQLVWAGELEGWLTSRPKWHLVAEGAMAVEWEIFLRDSLGEPVQVTKPLTVQELAASTARRATGGNPGAVLLPAEFTARYHQQFVDRLWLRGLMAAGVLYAIGLVIYFCSTTVLGLQTGKVEQQVAAISNDYTNALQLKERYEVLKERQDLKFAALDCWKLVADHLPIGISLQRFSFGDGHRLTLSGTVTPDQITPITDFYDGLRKAQLNGQPMFSVADGDELSYHQSGDQVSWNFSLELLHAEEEDAQ
jgi:hypothetical protein